jgi:hypothetical protein
MLGAIVLDFIDQMKAHPDAKGWAISPLVTHPDSRLGHGCFLAVKPVPASGSPTDFFIKHCREDVADAVVKVKIEKMPLRLIGLTMGAPRTLPTASPKHASPLVYLSYWRANGFGQTTLPVSNYWGKRGKYLTRPRSDDWPDGYDAMVTNRIYRITKKPSKKKKTVIHHDYLDLASTASMHRQLLITMEVLKRSLKEENRKAVFRLSAQSLMIDINSGHEFHVDESFMHMMEYR